MPPRCRAIDFPRGRVTGSLQRFQRAGVEEKWHDAYEGDAVAVGPGFFVGIAGYDDLSEVVADVPKVVSFNCHFGFPVYMFMLFLKKMSMGYQKLFLASRDKDSVALNFRASAQKFKVKEAA